MSELALLALGAILLLVLLVAIALAVRRRRGEFAAPQGGPGIVWDAQPPPEPAVAGGEGLQPAASAGPTPDPLAAEPAPGQVHYCRCPACQTQFTVNGAKPIVTNCPGCGKKGYLR